MPPKDPVLAAILSGLIPGLGQIYCRRWGRGALIFFGTVLLGGIVPPLGLMVSIGIWIWGVVDAYRIAKGTLDRGPAGDGPVIDISSPSFPAIDMRQAATYVGIPLGVVALMAIVAVLALSRYGLWGNPESGTRPEPLINRIEEFRVKTGSYPDSLLALVDPTDPIEKRQIIDSWGRSYLYRRTGEGFELSSAGKDGKPDTEDDIRYHP